MAYYYALACHSPEMRATVGVNTVTAIFDRKLALTARRKFIALTARTPVRSPRNRRRSPPPPFAKVPNR